MVPELHSGLLDLIRVLGKLAHCASRTTIICEPFVPFHTSTRYHKNCNGSPSPLETTLKQLRSRPSSFWNPVQPKTYYYNCFNYQNVPARNEHYQEIDNKYEQIKQNKLCYDPPECAEDHISKFLSDSDTRIRHKEHNEKLLYDTNKSGHLRPTKTQSAHTNRPGELTSKSSRPQPQAMNEEPEFRRQGLGVKTESKAQGLIVKPESKAQGQEMKPGSKAQTQNANPETKAQTQNANPETKAQTQNANPETKAQAQSLKPGSKAQILSAKPEPTYGIVDSKFARPESKSLNPEFKKSIRPESKSARSVHEEKGKRNFNAEEFKDTKEKSSNKFSSNYSRSDPSTETTESKPSCNLESSDSGSETQVRKLPASTSSKKSMTKSAKSTADLYKSDVEELKEMIQRLENENLLRYQAMLSLMREMSTKDFCRATCDRKGASNDFCRGASDREIKAKDSSSIDDVTVGGMNSMGSGELRNKSQKSACFDHDLATTSGSSLASESEKSVNRSGKGSPKTLSSQSKSSAGNQDLQSKATCFVGDAEMTLHNLMEMSSIIADVVVFETVKELMSKYKYRPPCKDSDGKPFEKEEHGTFDSPFETTSSRKVVSSGKSIESTKKAYGQPLPSTSGKIAEKSSVMEDASVSREPFVETQSIKSSHVSKPRIPTGTEVGVNSLKNTITSKKGAPEEHSLGGSITSDRLKTLDRNEIPQMPPSVRATPKSDNNASGSQKNPACPKHGTSPRRSTGSSEARELSQSAKSSCRKYDTAPPTKPEGRISPCADGRPPKPSSADRPKTHPQDYSTGSAPGGSQYMRQNDKSTGRKFDVAPPTKPEIRMSPCADGRPPNPGSADRPRSPTHDTSSDYTDGTVLYFTRTTKNAFPPQKDTPNAAGFMLRSAYDYTIQPRSIISVKTDLNVELPSDSYGRLAPRNCLTKNFGIDVIGDVIDHDYGDTVTVVLVNHSDSEVPIKRGAKIAQLICERIYHPKLQEKREQPRNN